MFQPVVSTCCFNLLYQHEKKLRNSSECDNGEKPRTADIHSPGATKNPSMSLGIYLLTTIDVFSSKIDAFSMYWRYPPHIAVGTCDTVMRDTRTYWATSYRTTRWNLSQPVEPRTHGRAPRNQRQEIRQPARSRPEPGPSTPLYHTVQPPA